MGRWLPLPSQTCCLPRPTCFQGTKDEDTGMWWGLVKDDETMVVLYMEGVEVSWCWFGLRTRAGRGRRPWASRCGELRCSSWPWAAAATTTATPTHRWRLSRSSQAWEQRNGGQSTRLVDHSLTTRVFRSTPCSQAWDKERTKVVDNQVVAQYTYKKLPVEEIKVRLPLQKGKAVCKRWIQQVAQYTYKKLPAEEIKV